MPSSDITFCLNETCELKDSCFRATKKPKMSEYVSFTMFYPRYNEHGTECDYFIRKEKENDE